MNESDRGRLHHDAAYFREMYGTDDDPWGFDRRWYERRKYAVSLASLPRARYSHAFEPGCANGALTELLAPRCDRLVATDLISEVADRARRRLADRPHVTIECAAFPSWWPEEPIDLLVLSEVGYYLREPGRDMAAAELHRRVVPGGDVLTAHYTGETDYPMRGTEVAAWLDRLDGLDRVATHVDEQFEVVVWRRNDVHQRDPVWVRPSIHATTEVDMAREGSKARSDEQPGRRAAEYSTAARALPVEVDAP